MIQAILEKLIAMDNKEAVNTSSVYSNSEMRALIEATKAFRSELKGHSKIDGEIAQKVLKLHEDIFSLCIKAEENFSDEARMSVLKDTFRDDFSLFIRSGFYNRHVMDKPYGYAGDYEIIDHIYRNAVNTSGFEGYMDHFFLNSPASIATRNRKEDFKMFLLEEIASSTNHQIEIMDLASGPCSDLIELNSMLKSEEMDDKDIFIHCIDSDSNALAFGDNLVRKSDIVKNLKIKFEKKNAFRIALQKRVEKYIPQKYDIVFSTGLFDYIEKKFAVPLLRNLKSVLKPNGKLIISNYTEGHKNGSRVFMEWGVDWNIIYRSEKEFLDLFILAGFDRSKLKIKNEKQGIMQYCFAST